MAIITYPLNNIDYQAEDAELFHCTRTSGIYASGHFPVSVTGLDNGITIGKGIGWIRNTEFSGKVFASKEPISLNAGVPDASLPRIDAVVIQFDANANETNIIIKQGTTGSTPTAPEVERGEYIYELHLYHIRRKAGATAITPGDITDLRMDANYCGLMADAVTQVDMSAINAQVREFISDWESQIANVTDGKMVESPEYPGCYYRMNRGVKEWLNPPMMEDEEYPTTKRQDGKRVYTKLLKARSQAGSVSLPDIERIVSVSAVAERDWNGEKLMFQLPVDYLPKDAPTIQKMQIYYQGDTIVFQSVVAKGLYNLYITVEYTKPGEEVAYTNVTSDGDNVIVETNGDASAQGDNLNVEMFTTVSADGGAYIRRLTINGVAYDLAVGQSGSGAPGTAYPGIPGMFYTDLDSGEVYVCVGGDSERGIYIWRTIVPSALSVQSLRIQHKTGVGYATVKASQGAVHLTNLKNNVSTDTVLRGIAPPVDENDAANKAYVDSKVGSGSGQNLTLDTTLTQSGKAADAKATGDEIKRVEGKIPSIEGLAKKEDIPTKPEDIGAQPMGNYASPDDIPVVPSWAMQASKPAYTASEVGALPSTYTPPNQTAEQVGADPRGTAAAAVDVHDTNNAAHNDIRQELAAINARLTAFFDSDNQTLDELSEIVAYITSNKSLIDAITTSKVSVSDIINNLTTNVANKPLSAAQGVVIKGLIDSLSASLANYQPKGDYALVSAVPTKVSQLTNDKGYLTQHQDISGKADKTQVATYITPEQYGAKGNGSTDDSAAIQAAIDAAGSDNVVYLAKKTYKISTGLNINHSNRKFVCEGTLLYDGTGVAVSITSKYISVYINKIDAVNGTAIKLDATAKYVEYCVVNVDYILNSVIGIHLYTNGSPMCYNRFYNKGIVASEIGVFVDCNANYITENWWWLGRIYGSPNKGIYLKNAGRNMFCSGGLEGINETGCAIYLENSEQNSFMDLRCSEYYGAKSIVFSGKCTANSLWLSRICLDEVDISELEQSTQAEQFSNVLRSVKLIDSQTNWNSLGNEAWVSYRRKITYNPHYKIFAVNVDDSTYPNGTIGQVGADIPTAIVFDSAGINGKTFKLSDIYNKDGSMAKGFPVAIKFGADGGKVLLIDADNEVLLDNTAGAYSGKTVSVKWNGLNPETNRDIWDIQTVGATYATEQYVQGFAQPKGNYLTKVPSGYATEEYVKNKIAEAELSGKEVDLSGYAQKTELPTKVSQLENDAGYLTEHQSLAEYAKKTDIPAVPTKVSQFQNDAGYLTQHQDISGKADKSSAETWTFTLADGSTVTKKVVLA